ncbi:uncharacterized protein LOC121519909 [Cheilinus undulatus]|uniref:uncharacterized protein LOC121519909 n=1 Tax=Cheilinus undulatus TaxID=241271 RepID=UPI001BD2172A|nr:uncharacterized protein LOC121519909 [Cheilinus undulatus]
MYRGGKKTSSREGWSRIYLFGSQPSLPSSSPSNLSLTPLQVRNQLGKIKTRKAAGPNGLSSRLLRSCPDQLSGITGHLFNLSLKLGRVSHLWKTSCVLPVPKTLHPKDPSCYRPVALTSHLMRALKRLVIDHLCHLVSSSMDPLQFAYQPDIQVDDAIISIEVFLTWSRLGALFGSSSWTSAVLSTPSGQTSWGTSWSCLEWTNTSHAGLWTTSPTAYSM